MRARIHIFLKEGVFDAQGATVSQSLQRAGFAKVASVRMGKVIDVEFSSDSADETKRDVGKMCDSLLANPVIESYHIELMDRGHR